MSSDDSSRTRKSTLPLHSGGNAARSRRSTLETFNEELAVLDRPLEGDVEYIDEPRPSRLRPFGVAAAMVMVGVGGLMFMSRHHAAAAPEARIAAATPAPVAAPAPVLATQTLAAATAPAPVPAEAVAPEAAAPDAEDTAADEPAASADSAPRVRPTTMAWANLGRKAGHAKHARATSGNSTTTTRVTTTTTRHTVAKRAVTRHR